MTLAIIIIYLCLLLFTSWYSTKLQKEKSAESFLFADKSLTTILVGVTVAGLAVGGASTTGVAQNAFTAGISAGWYDTAWAAGALMMGLLFAAKLRESGLKTINGMWNQVFGTGFQTLSLIIQLVTQLTIVALQMVAGGTILSALIPAISFKFGILLSAIVFIIIAYVGGMWSAALSNIVNVVMIYIGLILGLIVAVKHFGGFEAINAALPAGVSGDGSHWYNLITGMGTAAIAAWFLTMLLQATPSSGTIQVALSAKDGKTARNGFILAAILMVPAGFISAIFGIIAAAFYPELENSAMAMATVCAAINPFIAGILLAGLWAADVSTATGLMVALSNMATNDLIIKFFKPDMKGETQLKVSKILILVCAIISYIAANTVTSVLGALMSVLTLWAPYTILMFGIFWFPKTLKKSSGWLVFGIGIIIFVLSKFFIPSLAILGQPIYTTTLVCLVVYILVALFDKRVAFEGKFVYDEAKANA